MIRNIINQKCKGARDLQPKDMQAFRFIEDAFRKSCLSWGYKEARTPTLEYMHLFTAAGTLTPSMLNKVYSFLDWDGWSGERVVLRPDGTIPVARLYIENLPQNEVARLFYVTNVFAFEETGTENRERWQCGVELIGSNKPASDIELVSMAIATLRRLGLKDIQIQLSHAGVLNALLDELKLNSDEEVRLLDKILDGNWQAFTEALPKGSELSRLVSLLLDFTGKTSGFLENLKAMPQLSSNLKSALANFAEIAGLLDSLDYRYRIDITSTRGFEYYTGLCFQLSTQGHQIGSGGRYDNLIPLIGGPKTPACGFALYIEPLADLMQPETGKTAESEIVVRCEASNAEAVKTTFKLAGALRQAGLAAVLDFDGRQPAERRMVIVRDVTPSFTIIDPSPNRKKEASSIAEVVKMVGGPA
jgi:histidyl-tRNA synthetase